MKKQGNQYSPEEKVTNPEAASAWRRSRSRNSAMNGLQPTVFYCSQKQPLRERPCRLRAEEANQPLGGSGARKQRQIRRQQVA